MKCLKCAFSYSQSAEFVCTCRPMCYDFDIAIMYYNSVRVSLGVYR